MNSNLTIVIPAYNESESIKDVLEPMRVFAGETNASVIIVNDGSKDNTLDVLTQFKTQHPDFPLQIITHSLNRGYGGALKSGIMHVQTKFLVTMDADGQHRLEDISKMFDKLTRDKADMCIGNRNFRGSNFSRNLIKKIVLFFVKKSTGIKISDLNSGMKMYKTSIVKSLLKYTPNGMPFSDTIVLLHHQFRYKITEQEIIINNRTGGQSTINYRTAIYTVIEVANIIINFFPFKFFAYIAMALLFFSMAWGIPLILARHGLSVGTSFLLLASMNLIFFGLILENIVRSRFEHYTYMTDE